MNKSKKTNKPELNEFYALPIPFMTKVVAVVDGEELRGSNKLNKKFLEAMSKTSRAKRLVPTLSKLIDSKGFIPAFGDKSIFKLMRKKQYPSDKHPSTVAFYSPRFRTIVLCFDANIKAGYASNDYLARLVTHEGMHKLATENPSAFFSIFKNDLKKYYTAVFTQLLSLKQEPKEMDEIVKFIFYKVEHNQPWRNTTLSNYHKMLLTKLSKYTTLNEKQFEGMIRDFIVTWKVYTKSPAVLYRNLRQFIHTIRPLIYGYQQVYNKYVGRNFYAQEIGLPSEVIAMRSEILPDALTVKAFSKLA